MSKPLVAIVCGSSSDLPILTNAEALLKEFGVSYELKVSSAHRNPAQTSKWASSLKDRGFKVAIAAAGYANHLAGTVAAHTTLPVIGIPLDGSPMSGLDSLLSTVMMPSGVPVATVTVGKAGAKNAAILAIQILSLSDEDLDKKITLYKAKMATPAQ